MISLKFLWKILTAPVIIVKSIIEYYTVGTIYSRTNKEFNTLYKNVHLSVESHLANNFQLTDIPIVYQSMTKLFGKFRANPMVQCGKLTGYGTAFHPAVKSQWFVNNNQQDVILFLHGGGYALNCFDTQFCGMLMIFHALPEEVQKKVSILGVDYTLTFQPNGKFPTQLYELLLVYTKLIADGYTKVHLIGDSAGGNLALALSRFIAYPEEAQEYFSKFNGMDFSQFVDLPQPNSCALVSPWVQPLHLNTNRHNVDNTGDLGARNTVMGDWLIEGVSSNIDDFINWITFTNISPEKYKNIDYFSNGRCLMIYGEREVLRDGMESFIDLVSFGNIKVVMEAGGIHDGFFYVETLDYLGSGGKLAVEGDFKDKFGLNVLVGFYSELMSS